MSRTAGKITPLVYVISCVLCLALGVALGYGVQTGNLLGTASLGGTGSLQINDALSNDELARQQKKAQEDSQKLTGELDALLNQLAPGYRPLTPEEMQAQYTAMEESKRLLEAQRRVIELQNEALTNIIDNRRGD